MGGIGKTVLAAALAHDWEVRQAFPDGIYWLTIGQKPDVLALQNQLLRQLTGSKETLTAEQKAKDTLREALESRPVCIDLLTAPATSHNLGTLSDYEARKPVRIRRGRATVIGSGPMGTLFESQTLVRSIDAVF